MAESRSRTTRNVKTPSRSKPDSWTPGLRSDPRIIYDFPLKWTDTKHSVRTQQTHKDPPDVEAGLVEMMADLDVAVENKSDNVLKIVESLLAQIKDKRIDPPSVLNVIPSVQLVLLLRWNNNNVIANVAHIFAEVGKCQEGRERLVNLQPPIAQQLVNLLEQKSADMMAEAEGNLNMIGSMSAVSQVCRALGNLCYEFERGQKSALDAGGLSVLTTVLERTIQLSDGSKKHVDRKSLLNLRTVATGFLLNMICDSTLTTGTSQLTPLLTRVLELDGFTKEGEESTEHTLVALSLLLERGGCVMDERLCKVVVRILSTTTSIDTIESILDLLHRNLDSDVCKFPLARAGLCKALVNLLEEQTLLTDDEEGERMIKVVCDLIVLILNGDESMPFLYNNGQGSLYKSMKDWLKSEDENMVVTATLAMGNFARSDSHTLQMVQDDVGETLLELLKRHNTPIETDLKLQHALLCAIRNLAMPEANKTYFLGKGALQALLPLLPSTWSPVIYKLLGAIRTLIDGQAEAAKELGTNVNVVRRIVECCTNETHPGVKGEAIRLIAWIVKNGKTETVCRTILDCRGVPHIVDMLDQEHARMQNEAIVALSTICLTNMQRAETLLVDAKVASKIVKMLNEYGRTMPKPMVCNVMTLLGELVTSVLICKKLSCAGINEALGKLLEERIELEELRPLLSKLSAVLEKS